MIKIGTMTFHNVPNYGAILQAYALFSFLKDNEYDVAILDYKCKGNNDDFTVDRIEKNIIGEKKRVKALVKLLRFRLFSKRAYVRKLNDFSKFRETYVVVRGYEPTIMQKDIMLVCGSDQIWNPDITGGLKGEYFGKGMKCTPAISYAASCGDVSTLVPCKEAFIEYVTGLSAVGVREKELKCFLEENNINCEHTLDPVFLLDKHTYVEKMQLRKNDRRYILVYSLQRSKDIDIAANILSERLGIPVVRINGYFRTERDFMKNERFDVGPRDFLECLFGAEHVLTNSFHGLAFSILFEKNFNVVLPATRKSRISNLLDECNLQNKIVLDGFDDIDVSPIDYMTLHSMLNEKIERSKSYLLSSIQDIEERRYGTI